MISFIVPILIQNLKKLFMDKLYVLCRVEVLLPDDGEIKSHIHRFTYVVVPKYFGNFEHFIKDKYDFYVIEKIDFLVSSSPKYAHKEFTKL